MKQLGDSNLLKCVVPSGWSYIVCRIINFAIGNNGVNGLYIIIGGG